MDVIPEEDRDKDGIIDSMDVDDDGDGLIEIRNQEMLNDIRYNPLGTGYKTKAQFDSEPDLNEDPGDQSGCGGDVDDEGNKIIICTGYELVPDGGDTITLTRNWTPIADDFLATFDGNGNTIANLTIIGSSEDSHLGFFRIIGRGGVVQNLRISEAIITGTGKRVGSLAGEIRPAGRANDILTPAGYVDRVWILNADSSSTSLTGIRVTSSIDYTSGSGDIGGFGGLIGLSFGRVTNSYTNVQVVGSAGEEVGGLVGSNFSAIILNSYARGDVIGNDNVGGLVGSNLGGDNGSTIMNSYATGDVSANTEAQSNVGGLVGQNYGAIIANSYATGTVSGNTNIGGILGLNHAYEDSIVTDSYIDTSNTANVIGENRNTKTADVDVSKEVLKGLTQSGTGWPNHSWDFGDATQFPTLRSYTKNADDEQEKGEILCGQGSDWVSSPAGQCSSP